MPSGKFFTGAITLLSNVNLYLPNLDSILLFSTDPRKYPNVLTRWEGNDLFNYSPLVYAFRRPNPYPAVFGFHEIFHVLVIAAAMAHFAAIAIYALPAA